MGSHKLESARRWLIQIFDVAKDARVRRNCVLKTDLSLVPSRLFIHKKRPSDYADYVELYFDLVIRNDPSGLLKFSLEVDGVEYSCVDTEY